MPEDRRGASWVLPVSDSSLNVRPRRFERIDTGIEVAPVVSSSLSVFHSPQDSHLPCQRLYAAPQFWQTKERVDLAMKGVSRSLGGTGRTHSMKRRRGARSVPMHRSRASEPHDATFAHVQRPTG